MPEFKTNKKKRWLIETPHSQVSTQTFTINGSQLIRPFNGKLHSGKWFATWK
jgi:hypothetical protein